MNGPMLKPCALFAFLLILTSHVFVPDAIASRPERAAASVQFDRAADLERRKSGDDSIQLFGPFKFYPTEGITAHSFQAAAEDIDDAILVAEQVDGLSGTVTVSVNGVDVIVPADLGAAVHIVSRGVTLGTNNSIAIQASGENTKGILVSVVAVRRLVSRFEASHTWIPLNESTQLVFKAMVPYESGAEPMVTIEKSIGGGYVTACVMHDDGPMSIDGVGGDRLFAAAVVEVPLVADPIAYRVKRVDAIGEPTYSDVLMVDVLAALSDSVIMTQRQIASDAFEQYVALWPVIGRGAAADAVLANTTANPLVFTAELGAGKYSLAITFESGITHVVVFVNGTSTSFRGGKQPASKRGPSVKRIPGVTRGQSGGGVEQRGASIVPRASEGVENLRTAVVSSGTSRIGSNRMALLCPFNFQFGPAFLTDMEAFARSRCIDAEVFVDTAVTVDLLRNLSSYGFVVLDTHGCNWDDAFATGEPLDDNKYLNVMRREYSSSRKTIVGVSVDLDEDGHQDLPEEGFMAVTPYFFDDLPSRVRYPNSVFLLGACYSLTQPPLNGRGFAAALMARGANAVLGFGGLMLNTFNELIMRTYMQRLYESASADTQSAYEVACLDPENRHGVPLPCFYGAFASPPAHVPLTDAAPANGGFESGTFDGWFAPNGTPVQFTRPEVLRQFGNIEASDGEWFARIALGPGYHEAGSTVSTRIYCPIGQALQQLSFDYNFVAPNLGSVCEDPIGRSPEIRVWVRGSATGSFGYLSPAEFPHSQGCAVGDSGLNCATYNGNANCGTIQSTGWRRASFGLLPREETSADEWVDIVFLVVAPTQTNYRPGVSVLLDNIQVSIPTPGLGKRSRSPSSLLGEFESSAALAIPDDGSASAYPSEVTVSGFGSGGGGDRSDGSSAFSIEGVEVRLNGLTHSFPDDLDVVLQSPTGASVMLMSDVGGGGNVMNASLIFRDDAGVYAPDDGGIESGAYKPTNHSQLFPDLFPEPGPTDVSSSELASLVGLDPIGVWKLFVVDNARGDRGTLVNGWTLSIQVANRPPIARCADIVVAAEGNCAAVGVIDDGSFDPDGDELAFEQVPPGPYAHGTTSVVLTVTDTGGLFSQCSAIVTVVDLSVPVVECPESASAEVAANCLASVPDLVSQSSAVDNCTPGGLITWVQDPPAGAMVGPGVHSIVVSATDAANNTGTCTTTFTVVDAQPPTITGSVPAIYLRTSSSAGGVTVTFPTPSASDNCSAVNVTATPASGSTFPNGKTLVTATAVDAAGLTASTQFTVKVVRFGESIGVYIPSTAGWFLRNTNEEGGADLTFSFGPGGDGWVPIAGDWDRSGTDTPGLFYNPTAGVFLSDTSGPGGANYMFNYGPAGANWIPLAGDWNGEGIDSIGLYDPTTGNFFLKNINAAGYADVVLQLGPGNAGFLPIVGDWNGDGIDTVGIYNPETGVFFLRNSNTNGPADLTFSYGAGGKGYLPISGDWNGDNVCTIGLYDPSTGAFLLRNSNDDGPADVAFVYGPNDQGAVPVAGSWDGQ